MRNASATLDIDHAAEEVNDCSFVQRRETQEWQPLKWSFHVVVWLVGSWHGIHSCHGDMAREPTAEPLAERCHDEHDERAVSRRTHARSPAMETGQRVLAANGHLFRGGWGWLGRVRKV